MPASEIKHIYTLLNYMCYGLYTVFLELMGLQSWSHCDHWSCTEVLHERSRQSEGSSCSSNVTYLVVVFIITKFNKNLSLKSYNLGLSTTLILSHTTTRFQLTGFLFYSDLIKPKLFSTSAQQHRTEHYQETLSYQRNSIYHNLFWSSVFPYI